MRSRMVQRQAVGHAAAAIVAGDREAREAQPLHHGHHVLRHGALGIGRMVGVDGRAAAAAVAAQIGAHDRELAGEQRRDVAPHQVRLREAVQQEQRRPEARGAHEDGGIACVDLPAHETVEHA